VHWRRYGRGHVRRARVISPENGKTGLGPVDILVNNAGITRDAPFHKMTPQQWHECIDTNLNGVFNMTHNVWGGMRERKFGRIVTISSINGQKGQFAQANYAATKAGDIGFTKALAQEGARAGITVNVVAPGYMRSVPRLAAWCVNEIFWDILGFPVGNYAPKCPKTRYQRRNRSEEMIFGKALNIDATTSPRASWAIFWAAFISAL